jgi:uncharacterized membrane protein required for colicin V production
LNLIDVFFIAVIFIAALEGIYKGFLHSSLSLGAFFLSILTSYIFYPVVSAAVKANSTMFNFFYYYTEGAEKIANFEDANLLINGLQPDKLHSVISTSTLTEPFTTLISQNVHNAAFASSGLKTLGDYYNMTIVCAVINIMSFIVVFLIARIIFSFVLGAVNYTVQFPELKRNDKVIGAFFGVSRGLMFCFLLITIIPVMFLVVPVNQITQYFQNSSIGMFFYQHNFFLHLIRGVI